MRRDLVTLVISVTSLAVLITVAMVCLQLFIRIILEYVESYQKEGGRREDAELNIKRSCGFSGWSSAYRCHHRCFSEKVDGSGKKKAGGFSVGKKKLKTKLTPAAKAKAAQAMELDN
ncbi:PREDICTED: uncharacterized protein LOC104701033 isoform X1 [Camelina sativa]|uniref:Uncharacterized protein LOC104701033 isoform X1 n=1 Tax=Camelina sativa TaxID=90675 RepID=A0ABM0SR77_CAMSA|nr:PREDICTED: uncharacterized protein LOC104701033 isoform X1 [Camelina sativa]XP_010414962.1 PREDICTED: uncharacterized protein LOC104701033 isoform X1 [Camelina sativa]